MAMRSWRSIFQPLSSGEHEYIALETRQDERANAEDPTFSPRETSRKVSDLSEVWNDGVAPTEQERRSLRKVPDDLPWSALLVAIVEFCERFVFHGTVAPLQNYLQRGYNDPSGLPGAIGLGQAGATAITNTFALWIFTTPLAGAIIADQYLGRYLTIYYSMVAFIIGLAVLFLTSLPIAIESGISLWGLIIAMIIIGVGAGGIKANTSPLIAEQYRRTKQKLDIRETGEKVIVDPETTIQRLYMIFYWTVNLGALSSLATVNLETNVGFWAAFLLPLVTLNFGFAIFIAGKKSYVAPRPTGSIIPLAWKAMCVGVANNFNMDAAKPSHQLRSRVSHTFPWDDQFIVELKRALAACKVFAFYPIYWLAFSQMHNNLVSQAGVMELHGIPNDLMVVINPLTIILATPLCDRLLYPFLRRIRVPFGPISRITVGFVFAALAMAYTAVVQRMIYNSPPCYNAPRNCAADQNGTFPNQIHVAWQGLTYLLIGLSEVFAVITGLEVAFTEAPKTMKSLVMAIFLLQTTFGYTLGALVSPLAVDPKLVWVYTGFSISMTITAAAFWLCFRHRNVNQGLEGSEEDLAELLSGDGSDAARRRSITVGVHGNDNED